MLIHVGLPKTATTFLQNEVFENSSIFYYLNSPRHEEEIKERKISFYNLIYRLKNNREIFKEDLVELRATYLAIQHSDSRYPVLSNEGLCAKWIYPKALSVFFDIFTDIKILYVLRDPAEWILSSYFQDAKGFAKVGSLGWLSFPKWIEKHYQLYKDKQVQSIFFMLAHSEFYQSCLHYAPASDIKLIQFETLKSSPRHFIQEICQFLNVDAEKCLADLDFGKKINTRISNIDMLRHRLNGLSRWEIGKVMTYFPNSFKKYLRSKFEKPAQVDLSDYPVITGMIYDIYAELNPKFESIFPRVHPLYPVQY